MRMERSTPTAGGCCSTPAGEFSGWDTAILFLSRETIGGADLCHTWGEDWGGGRETPGSDPLDPTASRLFLDFYSVDASVLQHEGTVRPLLVWPSIS